MIQVEQLERLDQEGIIPQTLCRKENRANLIFLDIDGVLNILSESYSTASYRPDGSVTWMDRHLVTRLNWLVDNSNSYIVISSSWRLDMKDLEIQLKENGFNYWDRVIGETPYFGDRGDEIQRWLDIQPDRYINYCVLEDEPCDVCGDKCDTISEDRVVFVDQNAGLSQKDVDRAMKILKVGKNV